MICNGTLLWDGSQEAISYERLAMSHWLSALMGSTERPEQLITHS
jgi:hypothetical protein